MIPADKSKERKMDRILVLKTKDGKKPKSSSGLVDTRLFTGENELHLICDERSRLWYFKYKMGAVPTPLKQRFTTYDEALAVARNYMERRDIEIEKVID
jgi:hypothetical protein